MKAIVTVGIPASGKSTFANTLPGAWVELNRDEIRGMLHRSTHGTEFTWAAWKWKREKEVTAVFQSKLRAAVDTGLNIICSDTNLHEGRRSQLIAQLEGFGYDVEVKVFHVEFDEACKRDAARPNGAGITAIAEMYEKYSKQFIKQATDSPFVPEVYTIRQQAIIVDIDGTLAKMVSRGPFEWDKVGEDEPNWTVVEIVRGMKALGKIVIIMSGRDGVAQTATELWLNKHGIQYDEFYIRTAGDSRDDRIIKSELYFNNVDGRYNVTAVFDDRPKVCQMWRSIGLNVIQIGNPYIFF